VPPHNLTGARVVHNTTPVNDSRQSERRKKSESITKALAHTLHPSQFFRTEVFHTPSTMKNKILSRARILTLDKVRGSWGTLSL